MRSTETHWIATSAMRAYGPLLVILVAHLPLALVHGTHLWQGGLHPHFPLVLAFALALIWNRWFGRRKPRLLTAAFAFLLVASGGLLLLGGIILGSPPVGYLAALVTSAGVLLRACPATLRSWVPAWILLWLLMPLPRGVDGLLELELLSYSTWAASLALDFFHVNHLRTGNVIEIPGMQFSAEDICSGLRSVYLLTAAATVLAVVLRRRWPHAVLLVVAAAGWAGAMTVVSIAGVVLAASRFGVDLSTGWQHELWELATLGVAFWLAVSTDRLLWVAFAPIDETAEPFFDEDATFEAGEDEEELTPGNMMGTGRRLETARTRLGFLHSWALAGLFAGVGLLQLVPRSSTMLPVRRERAVQLSHLSEETLPVELAGWRRVGFDTRRRRKVDWEGEFSASWRYERNGRQASVSLDFPFPGWHPVTTTYLHRGGRVREYRVETLDCRDPSTPAGLLAVVSLEMERSRPALLLFAEWDAEGSYLTPPLTAESSLATVLTDLLQRWTSWNRLLRAREVYQLQLVFGTGRTSAPEFEAPSDQVAGVRRLFTELAPILRQKTAGAAGGAN